MSVRTGMEDARARGGGRPMKRTVALSVVSLLALAGAAAFALAQGGPALEGSPGEMQGSILNTYPRDRIFEMRIHAVKRGKKWTDKVLKRGGPVPGQIVYVEAPVEVGAYDERGQ